MALTAAAGGEPAALTDLARFTGYLIRRAAQVHVARWIAEVSAEVTSVQFGVLATLRGAPGLSQRELGDALGLDRSTIADLVRRMEARGQLERLRHGSDRRTNTLRLAPRGEQDYLALAPLVSSMNTGLTGALTSSERGELHRLLGLVIDP
jgi:DNA-binding MarR family transcriptional regulator